MTAAIAHTEAWDDRCDWCGGIVGELSDLGCDCRPCIVCGIPLEEGQDVVHAGCKDFADSDDPDPIWADVRRIEDVPVREGLL